MMRKTGIENLISRIAIDKLVAHPDNPNRMSKANFAKLVRNIERTGRYEPLLVRPLPRAAEPQPQPEQRSASGGCATRPGAAGRQKNGHFQIINGHHRWQALAQLGWQTCDAIVWDIDDKQTDILLATLNRLGGSDVLEKKLALLKRLNKKMAVRELAKLLPQTAKQIERLASLASGHSSLVAQGTGDKNRVTAFLNPLVFFVNDKQQQIVENALSLAISILDTRYSMLDEPKPILDGMDESRPVCDGLDENRESRIDKPALTKAGKRAAALTYIALKFEI